jgi:hypothetical protein
MKHFFAFILGIVVTICTASFVSDYHLNDSILKDGVKMIPHSRGYKLIGFLDESTGMIGFLTNSSAMTVRIEPMFEDAFNSGHMLMAVKQNGKWGVMDLGLRFKTGKNIREPIVPCKYKRVEVVDDYTVVLDGRKYDLRAQYEMY